MKRFELLTEAQEKTSKTGLQNLVSEELRVLNKEISDLEFNITTEENKVKNRLQSDVMVTKTEVLTIYAEVVKLRNQKELLQNFVKEYYAN